MVKSRYALGVLAMVLGMGLLPSVDITREAESLGGRSRSVHQPNVASSRLTLIFPQPVQAQESTSTHAEPTGVVSHSPLPWLGLGVFSVALFFSVYKTITSARKVLGPQPSLSPRQERDNDIVTVSKLQLALLSYARDVPTQLATLRQENDPFTHKGRWQLLRESSLLLLNHTEHWSYVWGSSQTFQEEQAPTRYAQLASQDLAYQQVDQEQALIQALRSPTSGAADSCTYFVVTLTVMSANDQPLFDEIHSQESLTITLKRLASLRADFLRQVGVFCRPREANDGLTYDELVVDYTKMMPIT